MIESRKSATELQKRSELRLAAVMNGILRQFLMHRVQSGCNYTHFSDYTMHHSATPTRIGLDSKFQIRIPRILRVINYVQRFRCIFEFEWNFVLLPKKKLVFSYISFTFKYQIMIAWVKVCVYSVWQQVRQDRGQDKQSRLYIHLIAQVQMIVLEDLWTQEDHDFVFYHSTIEWQLNHLRYGYGLRSK